MPRTARTTPRLLPRFMGGSTLFNGASSVISCGVLPSITASQQEIAISFWAKLHSANKTVDAIILGNAGNNCTNGFCVRKYTDQKIIVYHGGASASFIPKYDTWNFYTVVIKRATSIEIFENGILKGSKYTGVSDYSLVNGSTPFRIGATGTQWFRGLISEVSLVPRIVTESERYAIMNGSFPSDTTNLWKLDDQPSAYVDHIGGANGTGTATKYSADVPTQQRSLADEEAKASLWFDGVDDKITIPNASQIQFNANPFSVAVRIKIRTKGSWRVINKWDTKGWLIDTGVGGVRFRVYDGTNGRDFQPSCVLNANEWITIVATCSIANNRMRLYVNGQLIGEADVNSLSSVATAAGKDIGVGTLASSQWLPGLMKSIHLWNRELTHDEVKSLVFGNIIPRSGLVDERILNEGAGTVAYDTSGNGNHGTITGAVWSSDVPSKKRKVIGGNLVNNGDFSYQPPFVANQTTSGRWLDGTAAGSTSKLPINVHVSFGGAAGDKYVRLTERNGMKCLLIHTNAGAHSEVRLGSTVYYGVRSNQDFDVKPNTQYKLSGYIEAENVSGDSANGGYVQVLFSKGDGTSSEAKSSPNIKVNSPRTYFETIFTTNSTSRCGHIECRVYGNTGAATLAGDFYFSDIQLVEVGAARLPVT